MTPDNVVMTFHSFHSCDTQKAKYYPIFIFLCKKKKKTRLQKVAFIAPFIHEPTFKSLQPVHFWSLQVCRCLISLFIPVESRLKSNFSRIVTLLVLRDLNRPCPYTLLFLVFIFFIQLPNLFSQCHLLNNSPCVSPPTALVSPMTRCPKQRQTWWVTVSSTLVATLCWSGSLLLKTLSRTRSPASSYSCALPLYYLTNTHPDTHTNVQSFNQCSRRAHTMQNI